MLVSLCRFSSIPPAAAVPFCDLRARARASTLNHARTHLHRGIRPAVRGRTCARVSLCVCACPWVRVYVRFYCSAAAAAEKDRKLKLTHDKRGRRSLGANIIHSLSSDTPQNRHHHHVCAQIFSNLATVFKNPY